MRLKTLIVCCLVLFHIGLLGQTAKEKFATAIANSDMQQQLAVANVLTSQYSSFNYAYYGLMLKSLPKNSVLITNALDDTFPLTILQIKNKLRPDVKIISLGMLKDSTYVNYINEVHQLELDYKSPSAAAAVFISKLKNVHISTTVSSSIWYKPSYYLEGLTVQTSGQNQMKSLADFYEDYQKLKFKSFSLTGFDRSLLQNILPPLITLYKNGNSSLSLKKEIQYLAGLIGKSEAVNKIIAID